MNRCPLCKSTLSLEALLENEAEAELRTLYAEQPPALARALARYLACWAAAKSDMAASRKLRLGREALAFSQNEGQLTAALCNTAEGIFKKRREGQNNSPLSSHQYLLRVLADTPEVSLVDTPAAPKNGAAFTSSPTAITSKVGRAIVLIETMGLSLPNPQADREFRQAAVRWIHDGAEFRPALDALEGNLQQLARRVAKRYEALDMNNPLNQRRWQHMLEKARQKWPTAAELLAEIGTV